LQEVRKSLQASVVKFGSPFATKTREQVKMSTGMSDQDMAKLCATTVAEVLKKLSVEGSKMENHASNGIKHIIPMLKKDELDDYLAWSNTMQGLILATDCSAAVDVKKCKIC
jgi:hypothetical protein